MRMSKFAARLLALALFSALEKPPGTGLVY
jgi:hypothetical protein